MLKQALICLVLAASVFHADYMIKFVGRGYNYERLSIAQTAKICGELSALGAALPRQLVEAECRWTPIVHHASWGLIAILLALAAYSGWNAKMAGPGPKTQ
jgi:hypothetical protein